MLHSVMLLGEKKETLAFTCKSGRGPEWGAVLTIQIVGTLQRVQRHPRGHGSNSQC